MVAVLVPIGYFLLVPKNELSKNFSSKTADSPRCPFSRYQIIRVDKCAFGYVTVTSTISENFHPPPTLDTREKTKQTQNVLEWKRSRSTSQQQLNADCWFDEMRFFFLLVVGGELRCLMLCSSFMEQ